MVRRHRRFGLALAFLLLTLAVASVAAQESLVKVGNNPTLGNILTDSRGMTLYIFTKDTPNVSNCYDKCATAWPPLTVPEGQSVAGSVGGGTLSRIERKDGTYQVAYNGMPLYFYFKDTKAGDTTGQNVGNVWFVVKAAAGSSSTATALPNTGESSPNWSLLALAALGLLALGTTGRIALGRQSR